MKYFKGDYYPDWYKKIYDFAEIYCQPYTTKNQTY